MEDTADLSPAALGREGSTPSFGTNLFVCKLFRFVWGHRFRGVDKEKPPTLNKVTGWRSCRWDTKYGSRERVTFVLWWQG